MPAITIDDPAAWDAALLSLPAPHILQSWSWGETKAQTGWQAHRLLWQAADGTALAAAALLVRRPPRLPVPGAAVAYVPRGPLWRQPHGLALAGQVLARLEACARAAGAMFLKIDPDVRPDRPEGAALVALLDRRGWHPSSEQVQFRNTMVSDLTADEATILASMKPKWRYNIRLAERRGVKVRGGGERDLPAFYAMYLETGRRDGFPVRPYAYYRRVWESFLARGLAQLLLAEVAGEGQPVAGLMLFRFGATAWYFYGASTALCRESMPNYALQWAALRWARDAGCTRYDWWGAPDVLDERDPMWGVYRFKAGFGGEYVPGIGAWDYPLNRPLYWLYTVAMPRALAMARRRHRLGGAGSLPSQER